MAADALAFHGQGISSHDIDLHYLVIVDAGLKGLIEAHVHSWSMLISMKITIDFFVIQNH